MFKKLLVGILFALCGNCGIIQTGIQTPIEYNPASDFDYVIENNEITITLYKGTSLDVSIPPTIEGLPVTVLSEYGPFMPFYIGFNIRSCRIPNTVKNISPKPCNGAFRECLSLEKVYFGSGVTNIGPSSFYYCTNLTDIGIIPQSVKTIREYAFAQTYKLTNIQFEGDCPVIESGAFAFSETKNNLYRRYNSHGWPSVFHGTFGDVQIGYWTPQKTKPATIITKAYSQPVYEAIPTNGLVLHYKMDENSWNGSAGEVIDSSGNGTHGTSYGGALTNPGKFNRAGYFDGVNDYVGGISHPSGTQLTVSLWAKRSGASSEWGYICGSHPTEVGGSWFIGRSVFGISFRYNDSGVERGLDHAWDVTDTTWHHIVAQVSSYGKLYVDGVLVTENTYGGNWNIAPMNIGGKYQLNFNGEIDDIRVYDRAISSNEVQQIYNAELKSKKSVAVYQGSKLVYNPDKKSYAKTAPAVPVIPYSPASDFLYSYTPLNKATITGYAGAGPVASIPPEINGREVVTIGDSAFMFSSLTDIEIPATVTTISSEAFRYSWGLTNIICNARVTELPNACFANTGIRDFVIPPTVITLGNYVFHSCPYLGSMTIPDAVVNLGAALFGTNPSLTNVVFGSGVTYLYVISFSSAATPNVKTMYFRGNAPTPSEVMPVTGCIVYRRADATGWPTVPDPYAGVPTAIWTTYPNPMP